MRSFYYISISFILICTITVTANAQINLGFYTGYGQSEFELQSKALSSVPLGFTVAYCIFPKFEAGIEYGTLIRPFEDKDDDLKFEYYGTPIELEGLRYRITQNNIGIFARYYVKLDTFCPYIKAGIAYYTGKKQYMDAPANNEPYTDFKGVIGYYPAMGIKTSFGLYLEFMYHILNRQLDTEDADRYKYNNYMIVLGYRHTIKL